MVRYIDTDIEINIDINIEIKIDINIDTNTNIDKDIAIDTTVCHSGNTSTSAKSVIFLELWCSREANNFKSSSTFHTFTSLSSEGGKDIERLR